MTSRAALIVALCACHAQPAASNDAPTPATVDAVAADAPPPPMACPTTGAGAFDVAGVQCLEVTPIATGEPSTGENAAVPHYALRPTGAAPATLVLFLAGSGGRPSGALRAGPAMNLYAAAVADGRAVLALAYANVESVGMLCHQDDTCFFPTRQSIILGTTAPGSGIQVTPDEGIVDRTARALRYLATVDPSGGWDAFLTTLDPNADPVTAIAWTKLVVAGHSQGGGHAAAIGKLFGVDRVIQLSSPCDEVGGVAATWTNGAAGTWASDPKLFYGLAAPSLFDASGNLIGGDQTCPYHTKNWTNLGMLANHRDNQAEVCGDSGDTHSESLVCADNYPRWVALFQ